MNKNSTSVTPVYRAEAAAPKHTPAPRRVTIDRIRQFARAYTSIPAAGIMTGIVLN